MHGIIRRSSSFNTGRIELLYDDPHGGACVRAPGTRLTRPGPLAPKVHLHYGDLTDATVLMHIVAKVQPTEVYNLGAQSHVKVSFDMSDYTAQVDAIGTLRLMDAIRACGLVHRTKFYQASTSELYGKVQETPQTETTPFYPRSPYGRHRTPTHAVPCVRHRRGGQAVLVLDREELPRGVRPVCVQRDPVQPREPETRYAWRRAGGTRDGARPQGGPLSREKSAGPSPKFTSRKRSACTWATLTPCGTGATPGTTSR